MGLPVGGVANCVALAGAFCHFGGRPDTAAASTGVCFVKRVSLRPLDVI